MIFSSLASGSSGNCFFIGENKKTGVLIDAGISCKQIAERLNFFNINSHAIKAIFITHEHTDHIRGAEVFSRKFNIPIFTSKGTIENSSINLPEKNIKQIGNNESVKIGGIEIEAFSKSHKAKEPLSYTLIGKGEINKNKRVSIITDAGYCCNNIIGEIKDADFLCLESNHDLEMLENGPYPLFLKRWIKSNDGHLSNLQASIAVLENSSQKLKHLVLAHLSQTNNTPKIALNTFSKLLKERSDLKLELNISTREKPTNLVRI